jgi:glutaredoxin
VFLAFLMFSAFAPPASAEVRCTRIEMFSREGCPHCVRAKSFLAELGQQRSELEVAISDVERDPDARARFLAIAEANSGAGLGVPAFSICGAFIVGFESPETTGRAIVALLAGRDESPRAIRVPLFGEIDAVALGLPFFTLAVGLIDGLNPCAMWVLLFLLSILVNLRDRRKILAVAGTFVLVSGTAYFLFMAAWLNVFLWIGFSRAVQIALSFAALGVGSVHVKDFFAFGRGLSLGIPESAKPGIYAQVRRIVQAENLAGALAGAFVLAVLVNFVELLCTAGLPALYTQVLTLHELSTGRYYGYLLLYNLAYMFDDSALVALVVVTLGRRKLREEQGRWLKLVSGCVMLLLGVLLLVRPDWLLRG